MNEETKDTPEETTEEKVEETSEPEVTTNTTEKTSFTDSAKASDTVVEDTTSEVKVDKSNTSTSIGTGKTVYNGACKLCGAHITNGIVKDGKVNCPTCKRDS